MDNIVRAPCQLCGVDRPLKQVTLMQNIGLLVVRFPKTLPTNIVNYVSSRSLPS